MDRVRFRVMAPAARVIGAAALALGLSAAAPVADAPLGLVVLKAARLFVGRAEAGVRDGVVEVEGGTIKAVGSGLAVSAGGGTVHRNDAAAASPKP